MSPGITQRPRPSISVAPAGIVTAPRGPIAETRPPEMTITASLTGALPVPSMSVAPTIAVVVGCGGNSGRIAAVPIAERHKTKPSVQRVWVIRVLPLPAILAERGASAIFRRP